MGGNRPRDTLWSAWWEVRRSQRPCPCRQPYRSSTPCQRVSTGGSGRVPPLRVRRTALHGGGGDWRPRQPPAAPRCRLWKKRPPSAPPSPGPLLPVGLMLRIVGSCPPHSQRRHHHQRQRRCLVQPLSPPSRPTLFAVAYDRQPPAPHLQVAATDASSYQLPPATIAAVAAAAPHVSCRLSRRCLRRDSRHVFF